MKCHRGQQIPKITIPPNVETSKLTSLCANISDMIEILNKCDTDSRYRIYITFFQKVFLSHFLHFLECRCGVYTFLPSKSNDPPKVASLQKQQQLKGAKSKSNDPKIYGTCSQLTDLPSYNNNSSSFLHILRSYTVSNIISSITTTYKHEESI